jgi:phage protein D
MTALVNLYGGADVYVPDFALRVENREISRDVSHDILDVGYRNALRQFDTFQFTINNWDEVKQDYKHSDGDLFLPGSAVELRMGYRGDIGLHLMIRGTITTMTPNFPSSGAPTLRISGQNALRRLARERRSERYAGRTDSEIARAIADRLDLRLDPPPFAGSEEKRYDDLIQNNEFDIVFLLKRARRLGYELLVEEGDEGTTLRYAPSTASRPGTYRLGYLMTKRGRALIEFNPRFSVDRQAERVRVHGWDAVNKTAIVEEAHRDDVAVTDPDFDRDVIRRATRGFKEVVADEPVQDAEEARNRAKQIMTDIKRTTMTATGRTVGLPDLRAGSVIHVEGVGKRFSGRYLVTGTEHRISTSGYTTSFECRREEL